jgi:hypothetical protein
MPYGILTCYFHRDCLRGRTELDHVLDVYRLGAGLVRTLEARYWHLLTTELPVPPYPQAPPFGRN